MIEHNRLINKYSSLNSIRAAQNKMSREFKTILLLTLLHIPLGVLFYSSSLLGVISSLIAFFLGLSWALSKRQTLENVAWVVAYIVGVEVLWRMAEVPVFWEFGKYASVVIMVTALIKRGFYKIPALPLIYFILLLPSTILTFAYNDFDSAREKISFDLSGPLCLFVCCWFFSYVKLNQFQLKRLFLILIAPILTIGCATLFFTVTTEEIVFNTESNKTTSGGFGPNQVSSMLGLGVFILITCFIIFKNDAKYRIYFGMAIVFLAAQSMMTFSRGGMYNAAGAVLIVGLFQFQNIGKALKGIVPIAALGLLFLLFVFPLLDNFTGGKLQERFEDTEGTNRAEIVGADFQIFLENPFLGVGVGNAYGYRAQYLDFSVTSHTEFSRLISEHGLFGVVSLLLFFLMTLINLKKQNSSLGRALVGGTITWCVLFMMNAGMRIAAPSFIFGLSFMTIVGSQLSVKKLAIINDIRQQWLLKRRLGHQMPDNKRLSDSNG